MVGMLKGAEEGNRGLLFPCISLKASWRCRFDGGHYGVLESFCSPRQEAFPDPIVSGTHGRFNRLLG